MRREYQRRRQAGSKFPALVLLLLLAVLLGQKSTPLVTGLVGPTTRRSTPSGWLQQQQYRLRLQLRPASSLNGYWRRFSPDESLGVDSWTDSEEKRFTRHYGEHDKALTTTATTTRSISSVSGRQPFMAAVDSLLSINRHGRRTFLATTVGVATTFLGDFSDHPHVKVARAAEPSSLSSTFPAESRSLPVGLLESRVDGNVLSPPPYGMETGDIVYPSWFRGTWRVSSTTRSVQAPCGILLGFASNATYDAAMADVGTALQYECRFVASATTTTTDDDDDNKNGYIADREFNVRRIAQAAFGSLNCVLDIPLATANKLTAILAPPGAPQPFQVDLFVVNRRQETVSSTQFDCSEVVREIIVAAGGSGGNNPTMATTAPRPVLKEVETTSLYTYDAASDSVACRQRSATYLLPSQTNPLQFRKWEMAQGRPVDVRYYDVLYTRKT